MMQPGETLHSMLPWDIPWWQADHAIFFGILYAVLAVLGLALGAAVLLTLWQCFAENDKKRRAD